MVIGKLRQEGAIIMDKERSLSSAHTADRPNLDEAGILLLTGPIDTQVANTICEKIIQINLQQRVEQIQLLINSPGGDWHAGFAIVDLMEWSQVPICTTGLGMVASMGLVILMAGQPGHRVVTPHTSLLSHCFRADGAGTRPELMARRKQEDWMHGRLVAHYLRHTALQTAQEVADHLLKEVDTWLTPEEAVTLGVADRVYHPVKEAA